MSERRQRLAILGSTGSIGTISDITGYATEIEGLIGGTTASGTVLAPMAYHRTYRLRQTPGC